MKNQFYPTIIKAEHNEECACPLNKAVGNAEKKLFVPFATKNKIIRVGKIFRWQKKMAGQKLV